LKEARESQKEIAEAKARQAKEEGRQRDSQTYTQDMIRKQKSCHHLKGGKGKQRSQAKDYAVYLHTFIDGSKVVKCTLCSAKWRPKDTAEFYVRNGKTFPNWTEIGWRDAVEMTNETSNRPSSSEQPMERQEPIEAPRTADGGEIANLQF
jgi:uncharacterized cysteine cluster protein YcgN (CxxCxxCC family)